LLPDKSSRVIPLSLMRSFSIGYSVFDLNLHDWRVYAGEYNISATDPNEKYYHIRRVVLHPGFNTTSLENDIALVITTEKMV